MKNTITVVGIIVGAIITIGVTIYKGFNYVKVELFYLCTNFNRIAT